MDYICGMTFAPFAQRGELGREAARESLRLMKERTGANLVIFVPGGVQRTPQSEEILFDTEATAADEELKGMIACARELGLRVALKPTVNCANGEWRAYINFFDEDVPCEPKWSRWFDSYTKFQLHYAGIAEECGCEMFIAGCEMVMSERREQEWRRLISDIRQVYHGPVSYNTDKYQEHNVKWWDCVDVISASGYYPIGDWENQLDRIEAVVKKFGKPFFFAEAGCMSVEGSSLVPNDWHMAGRAAPGEQQAWFETMLAACAKRPWIEGVAFWSWGAGLYPEGSALERTDYEIYGKPAEQTVRRYFTQSAGSASGSFRTTTK